MIIINICRRFERFYNLVAKSSKELPVLQKSVSQSQVEISNRVAKNEGAVEKMFDDINTRIHKLKEGELESTAQGVLLKMLISLGILSKEKAYAKCSNCREFKEVAHTVEGYHFCSDKCQESYGEPF